MGIPGYCCVIFCRIEVQKIKKLDIPFFGLNGSFAFSSFAGSSDLTAAWGCGLTAGGLGLTAVGFLGFTGSGAFLGGSCLGLGAVTCCCV